MSQKKPGFITGANAKIKMGNVAVAYCTDVSYTVNVATVPVDVFGRYEILSNEPVGYSVDGSLSVVRYTSRASLAGIQDAAVNGDAPQNINVNSGSTAQDQINPAQLLQSQTWDLEIQEKLSDTSTGGTFTSVFKIVDCRLVRRGATLNKRGVLTDTYAFNGILGKDTDIADDVQVANSGFKDLST